jgi:hypothetical protein
MRLLTCYAFGVFSKVGAHYKCKGAMVFRMRCGILHAQKGALAQIVQCRHGHYSYSAHTDTCRTGGERRLHIDIDTGHRQVGHSRGPSGDKGALADTGTSSVL